MVEERVDHRARRRPVALEGRAQPVDAPPVRASPIPQSRCARTRRGRKSRWPSRPTHRPRPTASFSSRSPCRGSPARTSHAERGEPREMRAFGVVAGLGQLAAGDDQARRPVRLGPVQQRVVDRRRCRTTRSRPRAGRRRRRAMTSASSRCAPAFVVARCPSPPRPPATADATAATSSGSVSAHDALGAAAGPVAVVEPGHPVDDRRLQMKHRLARTGSPSAAAPAARRAASAAAFGRCSAPSGIVERVALEPNADVGAALRRRLQAAQDRAVVEGIRRSATRSGRAASARTKPAALSRAITPGQSRRSPPAASPK